MEAFLVRRGSAEAESSAGVTSKDVTAAKAHVLEGKRTITSDSNDSVVEGTMKDWSNAGQKEIPLGDGGSDKGGFGVVYNNYNGMWVHVPEGFWPYNINGASELKLPIADVRNVLNIDSNQFLKTATIAGISGNINNYSGQTRSLSGYENVSLQPHPVDPSQGLVSAKFISGAGYFDGTSIATCNVANLNAANIKYNVKVGRTMLDGYGGDDTNTITGTFTGDGTAAAANILKGKTAYVKGAKVTGTLEVNSALSFSIAAISSTEVEIYWTNPSKGPFSGVFVQMSTSGYPGAGGGTRKYTGIGTNAAAGGRSSCKISGLSPSTKYYFTVTSYCTGIGNGASVNLEATTAKAQGMQIYTSAGAFIVPAGVTSVDIFAVGGGSAGTWGTHDKINGREYTGGGGAGGYTASATISVTPGEQINFLVGTGGSNLTPSVDASASAVYRGSTALLTANRGNSRSGIYGGVGGSGGGGAGGVLQGSDYTDIGRAGNGGSNGSAGGEGSYQTREEGSDYPDAWTAPGGEGQGTPTSDWNGTLYAGGGGGYYRNLLGTQTLGGAGGSGGGGAGASSSNPSRTAGNGTAGSGGGGGGGEWSSYPSGNGGSGVVIFRWGY